MADKLNRDEELAEERERLAQALNRSRMNEPKFEKHCDLCEERGYTGIALEHDRSVHRPGGLGMMGTAADGWGNSADPREKLRRGERGFFLLPFLFGIGLGAVAASEDKRKVVVVEKHVAGCRCDACGGAK